MPERLPIDDHLDAIAAALARARAVVVTAPPGTGKTTRVPAALTVDGPVLLLQPRRVAARAIAARIAEERGWTIGGDVGWHVRFERRFGPGTRLLVATEGILTARLQRDPLLSGFSTVVLDEFHERSIHGDLGLAFARQAWLARGDLRLVVMSATMDPAPVSSFLGGCPVVQVPERRHHVTVTYAPAQPLGAATVELLDASDGDVLCFLPGAPEIRRAAQDLESRLSSGRVAIVPLHGGLDASAQDIAVRPSSGRRVILATNIAETSLTVPGVTAVVDSGLQKVARYDPDRAIDSLDTERISRDAADQRAGRAGRTGSGLARRLWDARDRLRPTREPDVRRIDLSSSVLDVLAWGGDPLSFDWFERPDEHGLTAAVELLTRLDCVEAGRLTPTGRLVHRLALHPRLGRLLVEAGGAFEAAAACALLAERRFFAPHAASTTSDIVSMLDDWSHVPAHVKRVTAEIERLAARGLGSQRRARIDETALRRAILAGYPDRVACRRAPGSARVVLASGHGATVAEESGVREGDSLVAVDVQGGAGRPDARIRLASRVEREWLRPTHGEVATFFDAASGTVKAVRREKYGAITLAEHPASPDPEECGRLLAAALIARGLSDDDQRLVRRLAFAGHRVDVAALVAAAARGERTLADIDLTAHVDAGARRDLPRLAPDRISLPNGRSVRVDYGADGSVSVAVKLQDVFGLVETPRLGPRGEPVLFVLLAPNGRPVQQTRDLRSFWTRGYADVRKELRGRYPKHAWPEDPHAGPRPAPRRDRPNRDRGRR